MKKLIIVLALSPLATFAQDSERFIGRGLFACKGTLAIGSPTDYGNTNMYVSGNLEYYIEENISFRGGLWFFLGTTGSNDIFANNHSLFTGFYYHFRTRNNIDPYIAIEPGVSWTQLKRPEDPTAASYPYNLSKYPHSVSPVASVGFGINYYATRFTHLFIEAKYQHGIHVSDVPAVSLNEIKIAFGFGFNIWTMKEDKRRSAI